ncbi:MAG TPA: hypothetical protein VGM18_16950 [Candidatus Sulfotelmatobacter sp.]|jgi:hypothetical protein
MRRFAAVIALLSVSAGCLAADTENFNHVKIRRHRSANDRVLVDKVGVLTFDDGNHKLSYKSIVDDRFQVQDKFEAAYNDVTKIVFEVTTHMRGGGWAQLISAASLPGAMIGPVISGQHVNDYWLYLEYKNGGQTEQVLLEVPKDSSARVIDKTTSLFGSRVTMSEFQEQGEPIDRRTLADFESKHSLKINKSERPLPEAEPDKATIVVVCPPLAARDSGKGNQFKLHADGHVIAVNKEGTYSIAYLDPGQHQLVSQSENANGFETELKAGKTYYFLQNTFQGAFRWQTALSRNSPELVTYLMSGTYYSDWKRK